MSGERLAIGRYEEDAAFCTAVRESARPCVRVYRLGRTTVVLGSGSDAARELHVEACLADGVSVERRRGGGCSVVIDSGNVVSAVGLPVEGLGGIKHHFDWISDWLTQELAGVGVHGVQREGVSDLAIEGRKFAGSCIHRSKDLLYYSVTMLVDGRVDLIERYLRHPPREPEYRAGRPHRQFVRPLAEHPGGWSAEGLEARLAEVLRPERLLAHPRGDG